MVALFGVFPSAPSAGIEGRNEIGLNFISFFPGEFDVYTMETALPKFDWEAIEEHIKATQEEEEKRVRYFTINGHSPI